jgi:hypothetical protein
MLTDPHTLNMTDRTIRDHLELALAKANHIICIVIEVIWAGKAGGNTVQGPLSVNMGRDLL